MLFTSLGINAIIVAITLRRNPYPLMWYCIKRSALTAFFTRSSAANIPVNMELCKDLGLDEDMYSVSIPLGCSMFGIPGDIAMQMVGIGFIISVIQDSVETALNSSGDAIFTATAEFYSWKKEGRELPL